MYPYSCELLRFPAKVNLIIEEISNSFIVEFHTDSSNLLLDCDEILDIEKVIYSRNAKPPNSLSDLSLKYSSFAQAVD